MKKLRKLSLLLVLELGCMGAAMPENVEAANIKVNYFVLRTTKTDKLDPKNISSNSYSKQKVDITEISGTHFTAAFISSNNSEVYEANASVENDIVVDVTKGGVTVNLYYTETGSSSVAFIDQSDRLVVSKTYANGASLSSGDITEARQTFEATLPSGYEYGNITDEVGNPVAEGLKINTDRLFTVNSSKIADYDSFDVLVQRDSGVESSRVAFDEIATVTSKDNNFSYWAIGEKIVSYEKEYSFSVYSDTVIKEVCGEVVEKKPIVTLHRDNIADTGMANIYEVKYEIPAGFDLVETGMIFGGTTLETATSKVVARRITSNNEYSVRSAANGVHRAYLIYEKDGKLNVIYDDGYGVEQLVFNNDLQGDGAVATVDNVGSQLVFSESGLSVGSYTNINLGKESTLKMTGTTAESSFIVSSTKKQIDKVVISAKNYNDTKDECTITVGGVSKDLTTDFAPQEFSILASSTVKIANKLKAGSKKTGRALVRYLEVYYADRPMDADEAINSLSLGDTSYIADDINLPKTIGGNVVSWTSSNASLMSNDGKIVSLPLSGTEDVTLTATIGLNSKEFVITLVSQETLEKDLLTQKLCPDIELSISNDSVTLLSKEPLTGKTIDWKSSNGEILSDSGVLVARPLVDTEITMTASIKFSTVTIKKGYNILVKAPSASEKLIEISAKDDLVKYDAGTEIPTSSPENPVKVKYNNDTAGDTSDDIGLCFVKSYRISKNAFFITKSGGYIYNLDPICDSSFEIKKITLVFGPNCATSAKAQVFTSDSVMSTEKTTTPNNVVAVPGGTQEFVVNSSGHRYFQINTSSANLQVAEINITVQKVA